MAVDYPPVGFHFLVEFDLAGAGRPDARFREVSGLNVTVETETFAEGGENRFVHDLPVRTQYGDLELKRGLLIDSRLTDWVRNAVEQFIFEPINVTVKLLNPEHQPLVTYHIINAYPIEYAWDSLNAEESKILVETIRLKYQYFQRKT
jgi:phage tail-like protein